MAEKAITCRPLNHLIREMGCKKINFSRYSNVFVDFILMKNKYTTKKNCAKKLQLHQRKNCIAALIKNTSRSLAMSSFP